MTLFRPCIDLHAGSVKQIVGGTLSATPTDTTSPAPPKDLLVTNHTSPHPAAYFASLYRTHALTGAHIILLGPGNDAPALAALQAWPQALQLGGGVSAANASSWLRAGAAKIIVTSWLFPDGAFSLPRLQSLVQNELGGDTSKLVIDLSCRRVPGTEAADWVVATNKWTTLTEFHVNAANIKMLEAHCSEFLIHAADVEGLQAGIDEDLVKKLGEWCSVPVTYAGGGRSVSDLELVEQLSGGKVDLTIGSALDIFGGKGVTLDECVAWNRSRGQRLE